MSYLIAQIALITIVVALLICLLLGIRYALEKLHIPYTTRQRLLQLSGIGILLWLSVLAILAGIGFFDNPKTVFFRFFMVLIPPIIASVLLLRSRLFQLVLRVIPEPWLILIQSFRIIMEALLLYGFLVNIIPFQMTFVGFNHDILVGVTALMAGFFFFIKGRRQQPAAIMWNISGMVLLLNAVIIVAISTPSPMRVFINEPTTSFITSFPFIWIPGFILPFAFSMHLFSIRQLILNGK